MNNIKKIEEKVINYTLAQKKINRLESLLDSAAIDNEDMQEIENEILAYREKIYTKKNHKTIETLQYIQKFDIQDDQLEKVELNYDIDGIIVNGEITMIAAPPGTGKSIIALTFCQKALINKRVNLVIYIDLDNSMSTLSQRNLKIIKNKFLNKFIYLHSVNIEKDINKILKRLENTQLENIIIVFDAAKNFLGIGADRDKNKDVTPLMQKMKNLRDNGATIIYLHHTNKPQKDFSTNYAGSSAWVEDCTNAFIVAKNEYKNILNFKLIKNRVGDIKDISIKINNDLNDYQIIDIDVANETEEEEYIRNSIYNLIEKHDSPCIYTTIINGMKENGTHQDKTNKVLKKWRGKYWDVHKEKEKNNRDIYTVIADPDWSDKSDKVQR